MFVFLVSMHESYYVAFDYFLFYIMGTRELKVIWGGGEGLYELPPSHGWPCSVKKKLFLKPRESHSSLYGHHRRCHHYCHSIVEMKYLFIYRCYFYCTRCRLSIFNIEIILKGIGKIHWYCIGRTRHEQWWPVNGANVEIFSSCFYKHRNLICIDCSHALMIWDGFQTQI